MLNLYMHCEGAQTNDDNNNNNNNNNNRNNRNNRNNGVIITITFIIVNHHYHQHRHRQLSTWSWPIIVNHHYQSSLPSSSSIIIINHHYLHHRQSSLSTSSSIIIIIIITMGSVDMVISIVIVIIIIRSIATSTVCVCVCVCVRVTYASRLRVCARQCGRLCLCVFEFVNPRGRTSFAVASLPKSYRDRHCNKDGIVCNSVCYKPSTVGGTRVSRPMSASERQARQARASRPMSSSERSQMCKGVRSKQCTCATWSTADRRSAASKNSKIGELQPLTYVSISRT